MSDRRAAPGEERGAVPRVRLVCDGSVPRIDAYYDEEGSRG